MRPWQKFWNEETGEYTKEFQDFYDAVGNAGCENYDCNQVAKAIKTGLTVEQAVEEFNLEYEQNRVDEDWEDKFNHDMSMN